jgi:hypothetical protein
MILKNHERNDVMELVGIAIYVVNSFLGLFSINIVIKHKKKIFIVVGINYLIVAILGLFIFTGEYLLEGLLSLALFGTPFVFSNNSLPNFITKDENTLIKLSIIPVICLWLIFFL